MSQWDYVVAVYAIAALGTAGLVAWSAAALRSAEKRLGEVKRK